MPYSVSSYDTYGAPEDWSGGVLGTFESYEEAVAAAEGSVDGDLEECLRQALAMPHTGVDTPERLASYYANSWERVSITAVDPSPEVEPGFDQFAYALKSAENLFATTDAARSLKEGGQKSIGAEKKMLAGLIGKAESGGSRASLQLSRWYEKGGMHGEYKIHEEALAFHRREATNKDESERWLLLKAAQDDEKAVVRLRRRADQGDAKAQFDLGHRYGNGRGVAQDGTEAVRWYRLAATQGMARAQYALGNMYRKGGSVPQDGAEAVRWYGLAATQGVTRAEYALGNMYRKGGSVPQDGAEAVRWYRLAAEHGRTDALVRLGEMHKEGEGVPQDYVTAHLWFSLAMFKTTGEAKNRVIKARKDLIQKMTSGQVSEAERRALEETKTEPEPFNSDEHIKKLLG